MYSPLVRFVVSRPQTGFPKDLAGPVWGDAIFVEKPENFVAGWDAKLFIFKKQNIRACYHFFFFVSRRKAEFFYSKCISCASCSIFFFSSAKFFRSGSFLSSSWAACLACCISLISARVAILNSGRPDCLLP